jgi:hypothetical protein
VGARHSLSPLAGGGGGYQQTCIFSKFGAEAEKNFADDPRLEEFREIGLSSTWLRVAEGIGVDAFLALWRILESDDRVDRDRGMLQIGLRSYASYLRYKRNRYIAALKAAGVDHREIQNRLSKQLHENLSLRHISRLLQKL